MTHCASLAILADYIGTQATAALVQAHGGRTLKIPRRQAGKTWALLLAALGDGSAAVLVKNFGGESLYIASNHREALAHRRAQVQAMRAAGLSFAQIAAQLKVTTTYTERGVRKLAGTDHPPGTGRRAGEPHQLPLIPDAHPLSRALFGTGGGARHG